jgi:DNA-directed RNA polymerase specialized sigma24 family protein
VPGYYDHVMASATTSLERLGTFPPVTGTDWRNMFFGTATPINSDAAQTVYDICWFLVKDTTAAIDLTVVTFRVALSRLNELPVPAAYTAWLASIASNECHRYLEESPTRRLSSALLATGPDREAFFLADTLAEMRADHKLAILLRYRYNTPPQYLTLALDMRPRKVGRLFVTARENFSANSSSPPSVLATATPPRTRALPQVVEPYGKKQLRRSVLGYEWLDSGFPVIPERDERRAKWVTAILTALILLTIGIAITRPWSAERPTLIEPNGAVVENIDG